MFENIIYHLKYAVSREFETIIHTGLSSSDKYFVHVRNSYLIPCDYHSLAMRSLVCNTRGSVKSRKRHSDAARGEKRSQRQDAAGIPAYVQLDSPTSLSYLPSPAYFASTLLERVYVRLREPTFLRRTRKGWTKRQKFRAAVFFPSRNFAQEGTPCIFIDKEEYRNSWPWRPSPPPQPPLTPEVISLFCQDRHDRLYAGPLEESFLPLLDGSLADPSSSGLA